MSPEITLILALVAACAGPAGVYAALRAEIATLKAQVAAQEKRHDTNDDAMRRHEALMHELALRLERVSGLLERFFDYRNHATKTTGDA